MEKIDIEKMGLSQQQAEHRLRAEGFNEIPAEKKRNIFRIALDIVREPMLLLLIASGIIYMVLGDIQEALMLVFFVFVIIGITLYQERKTERTLEALRDLSSPRALVLRDGLTRRIAGREVVREDIVILAEGDRVPADGIMLACNNLEIDESTLTGESVPVKKCESTYLSTNMQRPGGDNLPFVYSGTLVITGSGTALVTATGINTEFGKIGKSLRVIEPEDTNLQKETKHIVRNLAFIGASLCIIAAVVYGITVGNWIEGFLASITLAMAILPEEFPLVLTIFLALGAWRISKNQVLTRRMSAIEALGSDTVLCVDKTGTLTLNKMSVNKIYADGDFYDVANNKQSAPPERYHQLIEYGILASQIDPFDPMEKALKTLGEQYGALIEHVHNDWKLQREYPLSRQLMALSRVWQSPVGAEYVIAAKGAPEAILNLCHINEDRGSEINEKIQMMAGEGLRVIGVAKTLFKPLPLPDDQHVFNFEFVGLLGFADPVRPTVPNAIKECYDAGVRVVMITGDYPVTAQNIARQISLKNADKVITGTDMNNMSDDEFARKIQEVNIFARVTPEQKLRLVQAFKHNNEIVAMTGDGVNDAPALKAANIGIAMGGRGTDVAREAGSLVLLDDDFSSIVKAIRLGRRIFDNLRKAMTYILAIHVPIAGLSLIPILLKWPLILLPVHVVFLELVIDPACSIAFENEPEESDIMNRPPRDQKEPLFNKRTIAMSLAQGAIVLIITLVIYSFMLIQGRDELVARALCFTTLVLANLGLILSNRNWSANLLKSFKSKNRAIIFIFISTLIMMGLVLYLPFLRDLFRFGIMHVNDLLICIGAAIFCILCFEIIKLLRRRARY